MRLDDLLNAYRAELDSAQAPNLDHLFAAPTKRNSRPQTAWYFAGALAAAATLAFVFWPQPAATIQPAPRQIAATPETVPAPEATLAATPSAIPAPPRRQSKPRPQPQFERATFVALAEMDMLPEPRVYQVVRVSVDEARLVGLGLREARLGAAQPNPGRKMAAQVLLGEDGIARAIRVLGEERD